MDREITLSDIEYCRDTLQKAKIPYPVYCMYNDTGYTIRSKDGPVEEWPSLMEPIK